MNSAPVLQCEWRVASLTAEDRHERVVKDAQRCLVLDQRDPRIHRYRLRWYVNGIAHNRRFRRNQRDEAERLRSRLLDAAALGLPADERGLPVDSSRASDSVGAPVLVVASENFLDELVLAFEMLAPTLQTNTITGYRGVVEFIEKAIARNLVPGLHAAMTPGELTPKVCQDLLICRRNTNLRAPGQTVSIDTERLFSVYLNSLLEILVSRGCLTANPWTATNKLRRKAERVVLSDKNVASQERVSDIADAIASIPGGERFACPVRVAGREGVRVAELRTIYGPSFRGRTTSNPYLRLESSRPTVSRRDDKRGLRHPEQPLKHRDAGEHRDVPLFVGVLGDVEQHLARYCGDGQPFFSYANGLIPDGSSWLKKFWHPAVARVFGDSREHALRTLELRRLRHSAITWWLTAGASVQQAAEWAGNSPTVLLKHYAGFTDELSIPANPLVRQRLFGEASSGHVEPAQ